MPARNGRKRGIITIKTGMHAIAAISSGMECWFFRILFGNAVGFVGLGDVKRDIGAA